jgi:hypothetical protein
MLQWKEASFKIMTCILHPYFFLNVLNHRQNTINLQTLAANVVCRQGHTFTVSPENNLQ